MQCLRDFGVNVRKSTGLEGGGHGRKTAFRGATEYKSSGGVVGVNVNRSLGISCSLDVADDAPEAGGCLNPPAPLPSELHPPRLQT
jgi:hypothetical protein